MLGGVAGLLAALAVALVISFASSGHKSGHGCISVSLAYSVGGTQIYRCGASARAMCADVNQPGGSVGARAGRGGTPNVPYKDVSRPASSPASRPRRSHPARAPPPPREPSVQSAQ